MEIRAYIENFVSYTKPSHGFIMKNAKLFDQLIFTNLTMSAAFLSNAFFLRWYIFAVKSKKFFMWFPFEISQEVWKIFEYTFENTRELWKTGCGGFSHFHVKAPKRAFVNYDISIMFTCAFRYLRRRLCNFFSHQPLFIGTVFAFYATFLFFISMPIIKVGRCFAQQILTTLTKRK